MSRTNAQGNTQQQQNVQFHIGKKGGLTVNVPGYKTAQITLQRQGGQTPPSGGGSVGGGGQGIVYQCLTAAQSLTAITLWAQEHNNPQLAAMAQQMSAQVLAISQQVTRPTQTKQGKDRPFVSPAQQYQQTQRSRKQNRAMQNASTGELVFAG